MAFVKVPMMSAKELKLRGISMFFIIGSGIGASLALLHNIPDIISAQAAAGSLVVCIGIGAIWLASVMLYNARKYDFSIFAVFGMIGLYLAWYLLVTGF